MLPIGDSSTDFTQQLYMYYSARMVIFYHWNIFIIWFNLLLRSTPFHWWITYRLLVQEINIPSPPCLREDQFPNVYGFKRSEVNDCQQNNDLVNHRSQKLCPLGNYLSLAPIIIKIWYSGENICPDITMHLLRGNKKKSLFFTNVNFIVY